MISRIRAGIEQIVRDLRDSFDLDRVAMAGSALGLVSLLLRWLTLNPNRLVPGEGMGITDSFGSVGAAVLITLWLVCAAFSVMRWKGRGEVLGIASSAVIIATFLLVGPAADRLLEGEQFAARVSLNAGFWLTLAAAYMVIFSARRRLEKRKLLQNAATWSAPVVIVALLAGGWLNGLSVLVEFRGYESRFLQELVQHIRLFGVSVVIASAVGIPLSIWATRRKYAEKPVLYTTGIVQTIPSLALFGLLIAPLSALSFAYPVLRDVGIRGIGAAPAIIALTIYSLLPVVRNTFIGIRRVAPETVEAGSGMGMSRWKILRHIELPLAAPLILEGIRIAAVQAVGLTTVAALIGAGGLGWFVFRGIGQAASDLIILGAIPVIVLALAVDALMRMAVKLGTPRGLVANQ